MNSLLIDDVNTDTICVDFPVILLEVLHAQECVACVCWRFSHLPIILSSN